MGRKHGQLVLAETAELGLAQLALARKATRQRACTGDLPKVLLLYADGLAQRETLTKRLSPTMAPRWTMVARQAPGDCMTPTPLARALLAAGLIVFGPLAAAAGRADVVVLRAPTDLWNTTSGAGINDTGQVVGFGRDAANLTLAVFYSGTTLKQLGTLAAPYNTSSWATGINASGQVVGDSIDINGFPRAFLKSGGVMRDLGTLGGPTSSASGINAAGQVVGAASRDTSTSHAYRWTNGVMEDLGTLGSDFSRATAINASGHVVGYSNPANTVKHAFLYSGTTMQDLGTLAVGGWSEARAINDSGWVVGFASKGARPDAAFLYSNGEMQDLGTLSRGYSAAHGINATGQIVGVSNVDTSGGVTDHAFLHSAGKMFDLNSVAPAGWTLSTARAINAHAQITGTGVLSSQSPFDQAYRLTLHPDWQGGNGNWSDTSRWNYAGMGAFGITPGAPHDVLINPIGGATVQGPVDATVNRLTVQASNGQIATLNLAGGALYAQNGSTLGNNGTLTGSGRLAGDLLIQNGGRVLVRDNETMQLAGAVENQGRIDVQANTGRAALEVGGPLSNFGSLNLMNADLAARGGIDNTNRLSIAGTTSIYGPVSNAEGSLVNVSGIASHGMFWDGFHNDGSFIVTAGSTATFFGWVGGIGSFGGAGTKNFANGYAPGNSAALVALDGSVNFDAGALAMELGGTAAGSGHDKLVFGGPVALGGASLQVLWLDGFAGQAGDHFDLFDWNGSPAGRFASIRLPTLAAGLAWDSSQLYTSGELNITAVPEPGNWALMAAGLAVVGGLGRRRRSLREI